jgi:hypothetical protein
MEMLPKKDKSPYAVMPVSVFCDERLSKTDLRVLGALMTFITPQKNYCWPKRSTIAQRCGGLPLSKISIATSRLVSFGWLIKEGSGGKSCSSRYTFTAPGLRGGTDVKQVTVTDLETIADPVITSVTTSGTGKKETNKKTKDRESSDDFERFWTIYPKKCNKQEAANAWKRLSPSQALVEKIITSVEVTSTQNPQWLRDDGRYIPYPSTYLNGRRWEDQLSHKQPQSSQLQLIQNYRAQIGDLYVNNQVRRNRREHSAHIDSALDDIIRNEFGV